jgi:hypothetical protein
VTVTVMGLVMGNLLVLVLVLVMALVMVTLPVLVPVLVTGRDLAWVMLQVLEKLLEQGCQCTGS